MKIIIILGIEKHEYSAIQKVTIHKIKSPQSSKLNFSVPNHVLKEIGKDHGIKAMKQSTGEN